MGIVKSLIGSVVGAAIALGIHYVIKQSTGESQVWFPLVIGLIVGILARMVAGNSLSSGSRVVAGGLAALIAGVAMFAPDIMSSLQGPTDFGPIVVKNRLVNASIAIDDADGSTDKNAEGTEDKAPGSGTTTSAASDPSPESNDTPDTEQTDVSDGGEDSPPANEPGIDSSTDTDSSESGTKTEMPDEQVQMARNAAIADRSRSGTVGADNGAAANMEQFSDLIKKKKHESWMETFLPIIFSGIGMVMAYVISQSGSAAPPTT